LCILWACALIGHALLVSCTCPCGSNVVEFLGGLTHSCLVLWRQELQCWVQRSSSAMQVYQAQQSGRSQRREGVLGSTGAVDFYEVLQVSTLTGMGCAAVHWSVATVFVSRTSICGSAGLCGSGTCDLSASFVRGNIGDARGRRSMSRMHTGRPTPDDGPLDDGHVVVMQWSGKEERDGVPLSPFGMCSIRLCESGGGGSQGGSQGLCHCRSHVTPVPPPSSASTTSSPDSGTQTKRLERPRPKSAFSC